MTTRRSTPQRSSYSRLHCEYCFSSGSCEVGGGSVSSYVKNLTFAQLLSHTSGIKDYGNTPPNDYATLKNFFSQSVSNSASTPCDPQDAKGNFIQVPMGLVITPSNKNGCYSNYNFAIFRVLLPKVAGFAEDSNQMTRPQTLADQYTKLVQQNVFDLVGQKGVACKPPSQNPGASNYAFAYNYPGTKMGYDWGDVSLVCGAAGWYLSVEDIAKVLLSISARDGRILSATLAKDQFETMRTRGLGWDINSNTELEKNGGWGAACDSNGKNCDTISTSIAIFGPVTGPRVIGVLFITLTFQGEPALVKMQTPYCIRPTRVRSRRSETLGQVKGGSIFGPYLENFVREGAAQMKRQLDLVKLSLLALMLIAFGPGNSAFGQDQIISVAILSFQDDTGANAPAELGQKLAQDLHQKVAASYKDLLPRLVAGPDGAAIKGLTIEQIAALGKQNGSRFVARGGLLTAVSEAAGNDTKITVQLYADIISSDSAAIVTTVRAEGSGTQTGAAPPLSALDPKSDQFSASGMGQAFTGAIAQLADSIHQAIAAQATGTAQTAGTGGQPGTQPAAQPDAAQTEAAKTAEADIELQQLIAQAESLISSNANTSNQSISAVSQALEALKTALASKASLMEKGQDTSQADHEIATQKQALQTAVAQVTTEASSSPGAATGDPGQQPSSQKKSFMDQISDFAGQAMTLLQKIQEMRNALRSFDESSTAGGPSTDQTNAGGNTGATDQQLGEANGSVTDQNGNPVPNAEVTDQNSGATTTTDSNGQYNLKGLLPNQLAKLIVKAGDKTMSAQAQIISGRSATVDFQSRPNIGGVTLAGVLPSTVILNSSNGGANRGIVKGVVRDAQGLPVPRALVTLKGLGIARTNSQGEYAFLNVPAGAQQLIINQKGLQKKTTQVQVLAGRSSESTTQFAPSDRIAPSAVKSSLISSGLGATLRGSVSDSESRPVSGAKISVIQEQAAVAVFTGLNGAFEMRNLKPGPYHVVASKAGYENSAQNISLNSAGSESLNFQLKPQSSPLVAGLLRNESAQRSRIRGLVVSADGGAINGASVALRALGTNPIIATSQTNQNGEYLFNVRAGQYEVRVSHSSYQGASQILEAKAGGTAQGNFSLKPARPEARPGSASSPGGAGRGVLSTGRTQVVRTGSVSGLVIDARTRLPIAGAIVSVSGQKGVTDSAGNFALANLQPGTYQLNISKTGYSSLQREVSVRPGETVGLSLGLTPQAQPPIRIRKP